MRQRAASGGRRRAAGASAPGLFTLADRLADHREAAAEAELEAAAADVDDLPEEWDDGDEWADALQEAHEKADLAAGRGTITVKTIDGRDYYYLQWREGSTVTSQYVAPVVPAGDD